MHLNGFHKLVELILHDKINAYIFQIVLDLVEDRDSQEELLHEGDVAVLVVL